MSVGRPSVGKYVGGSSETARGSGDGGRSLGFVCAVGIGRVEEVHGLYVTMLNSIGRKSMGKQVRALDVVDYREEIRDPILNRSRSMQVTFQSICTPGLEFSGSDVRKFGFEYEISGILRRKCVVFGCHLESN